MASSKNTFEPRTFGANSFAAGTFRGVGVDVVVSDIEYICFTDEHISCTRMTNEAIACTRMIDETLGVCAGHAPATSITLPQTDWYFSQGNANGDGTSAETAWGTFAEINAAIADATIANVGRWAGEYYEDHSLATITSDAAADTWEAEFQAGRRRLVDGDVINFLTNCVPVVGDEQLNVEGLTGITLRGAHGGIVVGNEHSITGVTWVAHPSVATVWQYAITGFAKTGLIEAGVALFRPGLTVEADALTNVASSAGRMWSSATHIFLRPGTGSSNPNTDGRTRIVTIDLVQTGNNPGVIAMKDGLIENLTVQGGPVWTEDGDGAQLVRTPCVSIDDGGIAVLKNVTIDGGTDFGVLVNGDGLTGLVVLDNVTPRGLFTHGHTMSIIGSKTNHIGQLTSNGGTGSLRLYMRDCNTHADGAWHRDGFTVGDTPPTGFHQFSFFAEGAGGRPFKLGRVIDCDLKGVDIVDYDVFTVHTSSILKLLGRPLAGLFRQTTLRTQILNVEFESVWKGELSKIIASADVTNAPTFSGDCWLDFCTLDLRLMGTDAVWQKLALGQVLTRLRLTNCAIIAATGANGAALCSGFALADTFSVDYSRLLNGSTATRLLHQRNSVDLTFADAVTAGLVTNSGAHATILLNADYSPQAGSAVLGVANPANVETEDFGGVVVGGRGDVGVWEFVA